MCKALKGGDEEEDADSSRLPLSLRLSLSRAPHVGRGPSSATDQFQQERPVLQRNACVCLKVKVKTAFILVMLLFIVILKGLISPASYNAFLCS